jgi:hypothetical protein
LLERLGAQAETLHPVEDKVSLSAREASGMGTLNRSMFETATSNSYNRARRAKGREEKIVRERIESLQSGSKERSTLDPVDALLRDWTTIELPSASDPSTTHQKRESSQADTSAQSSTQKELAESAAVIEARIKLHTERLKRIR